MSSYQLVISPEARDDLKRIFEYSYSRWGQAKSADYLDDLKGHIWTLTEHPFIGSERSELLPDLRSIPVSSHVIIYRVKSLNVEIVRILHGRQDPVHSLGTT